MSGSLLPCLQSLLAVLVYMTWLKVKLHWGLQIAGWLTLIFHPFQPSSNLEYFASTQWYGSSQTAFNQRSVPLASCM